MVRISLPVLSEVLRRAMTTEQAGATHPGKAGATGKRTTPERVAITAKDGTTARVTTNGRAKLGKEWRTAKPAPATNFVLKYVVIEGFGKESVSDTFAART